MDALPDVSTITKAIQNYRERLNSEPSAHDTNNSGDADIHTQQHDPVLELQLHLDRTAKLTAHIPPPSSSLSVAASSFKMSGRNGSRPSNGSPDDLDNKSEDMTIELITTKCSRCHKDFRQPAVNNQPNGSKGGPGSNAGPAPKLFKLCSHCREMQRQRSRRWQQRTKEKEGACTRCGVDMEHSNQSNNEGNHDNGDETNGSDKTQYVLCEKCRISLRTRKLSRAALGKCVHCSGPNDSDNMKFKICNRCRMNDKIRRSNLEKSGACNRCAKKLSIDEMNFKVCFSCRNKKKKSSSGISPLSTASPQPIKPDPIALSAKPSNGSQQPLRISRLHESKPVQLVINKAKRQKKSQPSQIPISLPIDLPLNIPVDDQLQQRDHEERQSILRNESSSMSKSTPSKRGKTAAATRNGKDADDTGNDNENHNAEDAAEAALIKLTNEITNDFVNHRYDIPMHITGTSPTQDQSGKKNRNDNDNEDVDVVDIDLGSVNMSMNMDMNMPMNMNMNMNMDVDVDIDDMHHHHHDIPRIQHSQLNQHLNQQLHQQLNELNGDDDDDDDDNDVGNDLSESLKKRHSHDGNNGDDERHNVNENGNGQENEHEVESLNIPDPDKLCTKCGNHIHIDDLSLDPSTNYCSKCLFN